MKKLFLAVFFAVSSFSFAHCGACGTGGESKSCNHSDDSQCSSTAHDQAHKRTPDSSSESVQEKPAEPVVAPPAEPKENTAQ